MSSRLRTSPYPRIRLKRGHPRRLLGHRVHDGLVADMTLILVSNRLPVTVRRVGNRLDVQPNPGGVAAGLASLHRELRGRWVGWPGSIAPGDIKQGTPRLGKEFDFHPVRLPPNLAPLYYNRFSNWAFLPL